MHCELKTEVKKYGRANLPYSAKSRAGGQTIAQYGYGVTDARIYKGSTTNGRYYLGALGSVDLLTNIENPAQCGTRAIVGTDPSCGLGVISAHAIFVPPTCGNYYPHGKILRKHETALSRYLSTAHEKDSETGYDDRNARWYDDESLNFLQVDPHSSSYPNVSPYCYVHDNPIIRIDPDGRDDYLLGDDGTLTFQAVSNESDRIFTADKKGNLSKDFFSLEKGFVENNTDRIQPSDKHPLGGYGINFGENSKLARQFFEFAANNTGVEFSFIQAGEEKSPFNKVTTSYSKDEESVGSYENEVQARILQKAQEDKKITNPILISIHSHPRERYEVESMDHIDYGRPSDPDIKHYKQIRSIFKNTLFYIYEQGQYYKKDR